LTFKLKLFFYQDVKYYFTVDLTGIEDRSVYEICEMQFYIWSCYIDTDIEVFHLHPLMLIELSLLQFVDLRKSIIVREHSR